MKLREDEVRVPSAAGDIRTIVVGPASDGRRPGVLLYTDIFQLTESTLRTARRLASYGLVVVRSRDLPARRAGRRRARVRRRRQGGRPGRGGSHDHRAVRRRPRRRPRRDAAANDITDLFAAGFCIGGHLAFRAAFDPRVAATVCFYPTGLHNGALGADADAGSLARAADIQGRLLLVFGSRDPHVPPEARLHVLSQLYGAGLTDVEVHLYAGGEHAFMRDVGARHDPVLTDLALAEAVTFLQGR